MKYIYLMLAGIFFFNISYSQDLKELKIINKAKKLETGEMVARRDANGNYCAAIQVVSNLDGFTYDSFDGMVGNIDDFPGKDIVYLTATERVLEVMHLGFKPLKIILSDLGIVLKPREIWQIEVSGESIADQLPVTLRFTPPDASLSIDGKSTTPSNTYQLAPGKHNIKIEKEGLLTLNEAIEVDASHVFFEWTLKKPITQWIVVNSDPDGADVYLNENPVGKTPLPIEMPVGSYTLRLTKELYLPLDQTFELKAVEKTVLNLVLKPNYGSLLVSSTPESGALVRINGMSTGKVTPCLIEKVPAGECTLSLNLDMFETHLQKIALMAGETREIKVSLNPTFSGITVNAVPVSDIYINGTLKGKSPWKGRLNSGVYTFEAKLDKHHTATEKQTVVLGAPLEINLAPEPITGSLKIITQPIDASVVLNGKSYGTTPLTINDLLIGNYTLDINKTGYVSIHKNIDIYENQVTSLNEDFSSHLSIAINSTPSGASVYFDEKYEGKTPLNLTSGIGKHTLRLSLKPDYLDFEETIEVSQQNKYFSRTLTSDPKSQKKKDELAEKVYVKGDKGPTIMEGVLVKGVYQVCYVNGGPALFTAPLLLKTYGFGNKGITGANVFINTAILGRFMVTPAIVTWDVCSVGVGFLGVSSDHKNRFKLEIGGGFNLQFPIKTYDYLGEEIVRVRKLKVLDTPSSNGDLGNEALKYVPVDASVSYERYLGGHAFLCLTAGCLWGPEMNWYKKAEVDLFVTDGVSQPSPIQGSNLPTTPFIEDIQPYFGLGFRF